MKKLNFRVLFLGYSIAIMVAFGFVTRLMQPLLQEIFESCLTQAPGPDGPSFACEHGPSVTIISLQGLVVFGVMFVIFRYLTKLFSLINIAVFAFAMYLFLLATYFWVDPLNEIVQLPFEAEDYFKYYIYVYKEIIFAAVLSLVYFGIQRMRDNDRKVAAEAAKKAEKTKAEKASSAKKTAAKKSAAKKPATKKATSKKTTTKKTPAKKTTPKKSSTKPKSS